MTIEEVRKKYLEFFEKRGHKIIPPAPLVLDNDPTTLFTSSGMQPLVPYLMGEKHPEGVRLVDSQPSIRTQDIEEVGDNRHTTYFEMLGNWSLGDYFKKEQLNWFWEFLTKDLGLPKEKLWVSVFEGDESLGVPRDEESAKIWQEIGVPEGKIYFYPAKENWWSRSGPPEKMPPGEIGGPDSEVFYEFEHIEHDPAFGEECGPSCDCGRFLEIGNSVFMQYKKTKDGSLEELPSRNVDFGGGLERLTAAVNNESDIFKLQVFQNIIIKAEQASGKKYEDDKESFRIIADHIRAAESLISEDVIPSNKQQGYILRRLIRRAAIKMRSLKGSLEKNDLGENQVVQTELERFIRTLEKGLREVEKIDQIDAKKAFDLYQSYGFPLEITEEIFEERGQTIDHEKFKKEFEHHQELSRTASAGVFKGGLADHSDEVTRLHTVHHLILAALQQIVDKNIAQKGSNITADRMRMDFNLDRKLTDEEIKKIEELVNQKIDEALPITKEIMPREEAEKIGAQMEFGKKYPDNVSVYAIGPTSPNASFGAAAFSLEFCGGPHVSNTSEIGGHVTITKEKSASAGVRRIYAEISK